MITHIMAHARRGQPILRRATLANPGILWPLLATMAGWVFLAFLQKSGELALCLSAGPGSLVTAVDAAFYYANPRALALEWIAMVAAMMVPLTMVSFGQLAAHSAPQCKVPVIATAFCGYGLVWLTLGLIIAPALLAFQSVSNAFGSLPVLTIALAYGPAYLWIGSNTRARYLARLHRVPIFYGRRQSQASALYGATMAFRCAYTCLPIMVAPMLADQGLMGMFIVTNLLLAERISHIPKALPLRAILIALAGLAALQS